MKFEDRTTCFGLCLEPTPIQQLAFPRHQTANGSSRASAPAGNGSVS
jgi:hypothetical protein